MISGDLERPGQIPAARLPATSRLPSDRLADNGLHVEIPPARSRTDAYVSADPAGLLLVMLGRQSQRSALLRGQIIVWGRRPQALLTLLRNTSPP